MASEYDMGKSRLVTRRDFLKTGVLAGAALGVGGALTGSLAACGTTTSDSGSSWTAARAPRAVSSRSASSRRSPGRSPRSVSRTRGA